MIAARELRLLKLESDALRRELNEWRDRSALPRVEEPVRGDAFQMVMSGEVEVLNAGPIEEEDAADYAGDEYPEDDFTAGNSTSGVAGPHVSVGVGEEPVDDMRNVAAAADVNPFAHGVPNGPAVHSIPPALRLQTVLPRTNNMQMQTPMGHSPMVVQSPSGVSFENPAMPSVYDAMHTISHQPSYFAPQIGMPDSADTKPNMWNAQLLSAMGNQGQPMLFNPGQQHQHQQQQQQQQAAFLMNLQRQQALQRSMMYVSPADSDDTSVGSTMSGARRERSGSMGSSGSGGYGSPASSVGNIGNSYEMQSGMMSAAAPPNASVPRRMPGGGSWDEGLNVGSGSLGLGMMKNQPVGVGGGSTHGFAAAMMM